jgi:VWFA-related protein
MPPGGFQRVVPSSQTNWTKQPAVTRAVATRALKARVRVSVLGTEPTDARPTVRSTSDWLTMLAMRTRTIVKVIAAVFVVAPLCAGQQPPVFRAGAHYVPVDVVVTDRDGNPITDLEAFDFEIFDRGRKQRVVGFRRVVINPESHADNSAPFLASDVASNVPSSRDSRLFAVVIDDLHNSASDLRSIKSAATEFIKGLQRTDQVAVVFVGRSDLGLNFTSDRTMLLQTIDRAREALAAGGDVIGSTSVEGAMRNPTFPNGRALARTINVVANAMHGSGHSRRAIIYIGSGTSLASGSEIRDDERTAAEFLRDELMQAYATARYANVPIYALNPKGPVDPTFALSGRGAGDRTALRQAIALQRSMLDVMAHSTGGLAFTDATNLGQSVQAVVRDNSSFYAMGFYPAQHSVGRSNRIEIKVHRDGARVRARSDYAPTVPTPSSLSEILALAMGSGVDVRGLELRAAVTPLRPVANRTMRNLVTIELTHPVSGTERDNSDTVRVQILALDSAAKVMAAINRTYSLRLGAAQGPVPILINDVIDVPNQTTTLRLGVVSEAVGRAGTVQLPQVGFGNSGSRLQVGGIVLGSDGSVVRPALGRAFVNPLVPFQPILERSLERHNNVRVLVPVHWRSRETEALVRLTLNDGKNVVREESRLPSGPPTRDVRTATLDSTVALARFSGLVTLTVEATVNGKDVVTRAMNFEVR